jgi:hypothetical protein
MMRVFILLGSAALSIALRWFMRVAHGGKGYTRERRPRSVADYHRAR